MSEHPRREILEDMLVNRLPFHEVKAAVVHLVGGCDQCRGEMSPLATAMFTPDASEPQMSAAEDIAYERAISAAFTCALERQQTLTTEREAAEQEVAEILRARRRSEAPALPARRASWGLCEVLLEKSYSLRHTDRETMLFLATLAQAAADRLDAAVHGAERKMDMQARSCAEMANALRVNDDFAQAEAAMTRAFDLRAKGTRDPLLYARLADLNASLLSDQRRFKEAFRMLDIALAIHRRHSGSHEVGRVLLLKGLCTGYAGNPENGLQLLAHGLSMIDRARDPKLTFYTLHNILLFRVDLGEYEEARRQLRRMRPLYAEHAAGPDWLKLHWIEGQIAAGLGDLVTAEATFQQIRQDLDDAGLGYEAAIISLELAGVWLRQGRTSEVRTLVAETVAAFRGLKVEREALSALQMLQDTLEREHATLEVLRFASGILRRLQKEPTARTALDAL